MELMLFLRVLLRRWYLVLIPVLIVAAFTVPDLLPGQAAAAGGFVTTLRYTAAQVLEAITDRDGDYQDVWLASELTVNAFTDWIESSEFAQEVNTILSREGLEVDTRGRFATDNERSIGVIEIRWDDAAQLEQIAAATIQTLQTRSSAYFPQLGGAPAQVTMLDEPVVSPAPAPITNRLRPVMQLGVALLAGIVLAFLAEYFDPMLRRREQVEALDIPVLGSIPRK
jgi:capsular polysaccharide biosynthesis protein